MRVVELPATALADPAWVTEDLDRARRLHGRAAPAVLGTIRWYSASSVLVAPALEPWVHTGVARDPALDAVTFDVTADGRFLDAHSTRALGADPAALGAALVRALDSAVTAFARASGASPRALWAVGVDSIANRLLWAASTTGDANTAPRLARELSDHMESAARELPGCVWNGSPRPRFATMGDRLVLRRSSCCLIYEAPATRDSKCASCPRQTPAEREHRLRLLLGP
ncbi:putative Fe-S protein [Saccharomonospora glauca K62]|uniref:Putative Fe-S protein n=1 Tax=Saccharomonospora glauca K62 TaxID=928724 RepID=I1CZ64_9PSEU|nr:putative Fe-S protein [Saccharomonospora glauca K62]